MDALSDPEIEEVSVMKAARVGGSEVGRNFVAFAVHQAPGPFLILFPDEDTAKRQLEKELKPLLATEALAPFRTENQRDLTKDCLELQNMNIYPAWSGSPATTSEKTCQYVWISEADKLQAFNGRVEDAISGAKTRTQTYGHRRKIYIESTPTTNLGVIARAFEAAPDKRRFWVPCPLCGDPQVLTWAQVKWEKVEKETKREAAVRVENADGAWYECASCKGKIFDHQKAGMEEAGEWRMEGVKSRIVAFHISGLLSMLGLTWSRLAAMFLRASASKEEGDLAPMMAFFTQGLGEPWEDQRGGVSSKAFERKRQIAIAEKRPLRVVPRWGAAVLLTVDTQKDSFWWLARAWGVHVDGAQRTPRSRLIDRGRAASFDELRILLNTHYPIDGWPGQSLAPFFLAIDARGGTAAATDGTDSSRTDEVYRFSQSDPGRIVPIAGIGGNAKQRDATMRGASVKISRVSYTAPGAKAAYDVNLHVLDTQKYADQLAALVEQEATEKTPEMWQVSIDIDEEYVSHMTGEHKVAIPVGNSYVEVWQKRSSGRRVDILDTERYQLAAADIARVQTSAPDEAQLDRMRAAPRALPLDIPHAAPAQPRQSAPAPPKFVSPSGQNFFANRR